MIGAKYIFFQISYDDVIYKATVITQVNVKSLKEEQLYYVTGKSIRQTKNLLKETLQNEGEDYPEETGVSPIEEQDEASGM